MDNFCEHYASNECDCISHCYKGGAVKEEKPEWFKAFENYLDNTPQEELEKGWARVEAMDLKGPTVEEYFDGLSGSPKRIAELEQQLKTKDAKIAELETTLNEYRNYIKW